MIRPDGFISLPLLQEVKAAGLTPGELAESVRVALANRLLRPEVTVIPVTVRQPTVYVLGEVRAPGAFPLRTAVTAAQAIALAGGSLRSAAEAAVTVIRLSDDGFLEAISVQSDSYFSQPGPFLALAATPLKADDIVFVPESGRSQVMRVMNDLLVPFQIYLNYKLSEPSSDERRAMPEMKVVILCGGKGTRSYPFTEYFPKVMMPINGTPILVHLMRSYASQGFNHFVLAGGHRIEMLYDYFSGRFQDWQVDIVDTGADADTGDRILRCGDHVGERFFATYGDGLGDVDMHALLATHERSGGLATLTTVPLRSQYGLVVFDESGEVKRFKEKRWSRTTGSMPGSSYSKSARCANGGGTPGTGSASGISPVAGFSTSTATRASGSRWTPARTSRKLEALCVGGTLPWVLNNDSVTAVR